MATKWSFQSSVIIDTTPFTNAMKKSKVIMTIFPYYSNVFDISYFSVLTKKMNAFDFYSKVFDTIDFSVLTKKMNTLDFSKRLSCLVNNFLTDRWQLCNLIQMFIFLLQTLV